MTTVPDIPDRPHPPTGLALIRNAIADACARANRDPRSVTLVAASKTVPTTAIEQVVASGHLVFGENRVQEANAKWPPLLTRCPDLELHLIDGMCGRGFVRARV
jgi:uncharacterized pyridoxal phosphate-containing UPF0001 family protein